MLISILLKKLQKIDAQKVLDKNVMEKCTVPLLLMFIKLVSLQLFVCAIFATFSTVLKSAYNSAFFDILLNFFKLTNKTKSSIFSCGIA